MQTLSNEIYLVINGEVVSKANNLRVWVDRSGNQHVVKNEKLRKYESEVGKQLQTQRPSNIVSFPFVLHLKAYFANARCDLDNVFKTLLDCLQYNQVIANDSLLFRLYAEKHIDKERPRVELRIMPYNSDL